MSKIIFITNNKKSALHMKEIAVKEKCDYVTYTEEEWATFDDIEHYLNGDDPKQIPVLPTGCKPMFSLEATEAFTIYKMVMASQGNIAKASEQLNIGRATLYRKLAKHNLQLDKIRTQNNFKKRIVAEKVKKKSYKKSNVISLEEKKKEMARKKQTVQKKQTAQKKKKVA